MRRRLASPVAPATLFGLPTTFLSQDIWRVNRRAGCAVAREQPGAPAPLLES